MTCFFCGCLQEAESAASAGVKQQAARIAKRLSAKPVELRRQSLDGVTLSPGEVTAAMVAEKVAKQFGHGPGRIVLDPLRVSLVAAPTGEVSPAFPLKAIGRFAATYAFLPEAATEDSAAAAAEPILVRRRPP
jgi:hypothetical protein